MSEMTALEALAHRGEAALAHYGVKGMKWGVRKSRVGSNAGGGKVKVKFRPTYSTEERRNAQAAVKAAKKSGSSVPKDREGYDQARLAKLRTPTRRVVNYVGGTKVSNITKAASITGIGGTFALTGDPGAALVTAFAAQVPLAAAGVYDAHKIFFTNLMKNPTVRAKTTLTPAEMAKYTSGKTITKEILSKRGSATVKINKNGGTVSVRDREGRNLGSQTKVPKPVKPAKPKTS